MQHSVCPTYTMYVVSHRRSLWKAEHWSLLIVVHVQQASAGFGGTFKNCILNPIRCGGGCYQPSVGGAPTNPKFLDFSQFDPYFHLVKSFFIFFVTSTKKMASKIFFAIKKNDFLTKMVKNIVFLQILAFLVPIL